MKYGTSSICTLTLDSVHALEIRKRSTINLTHSLFIYILIQPRCFLNFPQTFSHNTKFLWSFYFFPRTHPSFTQHYHLLSFPSLYTLKTLLHSHNTITLSLISPTLHIQESYFTHVMHVFFYFSVYFANCFIFLICYFLV